MTIPILFVLDSSGSMAGNKIAAVNTAMGNVKKIFDSLDNTINVKIGVLSFASQFHWVTDGLVDAATYDHIEIPAGGVTDLGAAIEEIGKRMIPCDLMVDIRGTISKPVIIFMSDGMPTDSWEMSLEEAEKNPWFRKALRLSIGIGDDVDEKIMARLTVPWEYMEFDAGICINVINYNDFIISNVLRAQNAEDIIYYLTSLFRLSVIDGFSALDDASASKASRILGKINMR